MPAVPSSFTGGKLSRRGICAESPAPTVSMRYLPTTPLLLAMPFGNSMLLEFSMMRDVSHALAASTITFAVT